MNEIEELRKEILKAKLTNQPKYLIQSMLIRLDILEATSDNPYP